MLELHVLTPQGEQVRKAQKERLAREAKQLAADGDKSYQHKWMAYFDLDKRFDTVCHSRVLTAHSAQGSSIENVFLYTKDLGGCQEKQSWLYTALTRSKKRCFICQ